MNSEEYNNLKVGKKYTYICIKCGKECEAKKRSKKYQEKST